jgi:hypothetical protein
MWHRLPADTTRKSIGKDADSTLVLTLRICLIVFAEIFGHVAAHSAQFLGHNRRRAFFVPDNSGWL